MELLPAERQTFAYEDGQIIAGLHEHNGYRWYSAFTSRDREAFARGDDLKGLFVDKVDGPATS